MKKFFAFLLVVCMMAGYLPANVEAAEVDTTLTASLEKAKTYTDGITINNTSNDPATVVKNFGTHFTWDNEKRESSSANKSYLYDWSYYNGVVFEGIEYLYEVTGDTKYKDYVVEYMSSMITANGGWATCSNNSSKQCAGYNSTHGADCYKTASLLLDAYEMTGDNRYLTMSKTLYADLDTAAANSTYSLKNAGYNYRHTWASDSNPDLWLDGLYMILPFRAEYAKHIGDTEELDLIVDRMQWVSDNMYNSSKKLFYHATDSATSNSGSYWLRAIGWYAAAIVDIMDSMEGENLEAMKAQLVKLVDGMKACQNASNGMWLNNMDASQSSTNPYETSGTALVCYAVMKAVNEGWLDASYADMAILAFNGICNNKLSGNTLKDICFKGAPGSGNSTFYDNEGKGVGPFIMFYAEMQEYVNDLTETKPEIPPVKEPVEETLEVEESEIKVSTIAGGAKAAVIKESDKALVEVLINENVFEDFVAYDIEATLEENETALISIPVPEKWSGVAEDRLVGISVENGEVKQIKGTLTDGMYSFEVGHFSAKGIALAAEEAVLSGNGSLVGGNVYELDTDGVTANKKYLIVNTNSNEKGYALTNSGSNTPGSTPVEIKNNKIIIEEDENIAWEFSGSTSGTVKNGTRYIYLDRTSILNTKTRNLTISHQGNGVYTIKRSDKNQYLRYNNGWGRHDRSANVYLYELTSSSSGEAVTFAIDPLTINVNETVNLTGTVTVGARTVELSKCTLTWTSANETIVSVTDDGAVTGIKDGTTNVKVTLSAVENTAMKENIELVIPITVQKKEVASAVLSGNSPVTTKQNVEPDFSNIKLEVTYVGGEKATITVDNGLMIEGYDISVIGDSDAEIKYAGKTYGKVLVTVEGNPYAGLEEATDYPQYPADGAVRIDKHATEINFETTGVVQVELDVAGVSVKSAVDVILVTDLSNSMAWKVGSSPSDTKKDATTHEDTKVKDLQESVSTFADTFLAADENGQATDNTISLVTFGGYDAEHTNKQYDLADVTQTLLLGSNSASAVKDSINGIRILADDYLNEGTSSSGYYLSFDGGNTYQANYGNTNYDYAFMQTADAIADLKIAYKAETGIEYDNSGRQIYVLFMTDGAPSNYDGVYYNYKTGDRADVDSIWINANGEEKTYTMGNNSAQYGEDAWYQYIAGGQYNANTDSIPGNPLYWADQVYNINGVADIYGVAFDIDNGGFSSMTFTQEDGRPLFKVLEKLVTNKTLEVYDAENASVLAQIYSELAIKIRYAGTQAKVTDIVDNDFDLQLTQNTGGGENGVIGDLGASPTITISEYELWTADETTDVSKIGTRKKDENNNYIRNVIEVVTFNPEGTEAYSSLKGTENIMSSQNGTVIIDAYYFKYIKSADSKETFNWRLGNITEKEIVLSYYAYLTGSLEGKRPNGLYYTNEKATLEYIDINGKYATQIFPVPAVAWGGASTSYEFYLVNGAGQPCDRNGNPIPFANRIIITGPYYEELYLNQGDEEVAKEIIAAYVLPAGYTLYDNTAKYEVMTASGTHGGRLNISEPAAGKNQTTILVSAVTPSYIQSRVAFGVVYNEIPTEAEFELNPNEIVIDYGKSIHIETKDGNNEHLEDGYTATLVGFSKYYDIVDLKHKYGSISAIDNFKATYGTFSIVDANERTVCYTPTTIVNGVEKIFCIVEMHNDRTHDTYYMVDLLSVIPATSVYYETDFATGVFKTATTGSAWETNVVADKDNTSADNLQDDGTIGANPLQTYGYDLSYENDAYLSNGTSYFVKGAGYDVDTQEAKTYVTFSFKGTGFEVISRTGVEQGLIKVEVFDETGASEKTISVLNKSEANSEFELYQIPVVSINDLNYGVHNVRISVDEKFVNNTGIAALDSLARGDEFFFDAIRVFEPVFDNTEAIAAYAMDGEANRQLAEVRSLLITKGAFDALGNTSGAGMIYLDRTSDEDLGVTEHDTPNVATYAMIGPNNETYLDKGQAIAFEINTNTIPSSVDIGAKSITGVAAELRATITNNKDSSMTTVKTIASSTAQNINLLKSAEDTNKIFSSENVYVVITNTGDGVLSITDIKVAFGIETATVMSARAYNPYEVTYTVDEGTYAVARTVLLGDVEEPDDTPEPDVPEQGEPVVEANYDILNGSISTVGEKKDQKTIITVKTTQDVVKLVFVEGKKEVDTKDIVFTDNADGTRTWTLTLKKAGAGDKTYTITGYGEYGTSGDSLTLTPPKQKPGQKYEQKPGKKPGKK